MRNKIYLLIITLLLLGTTGCFDPKRDRVVIAINEEGENVFQKEVSEINYKVENNKNLQGNVKLTKNRSLDLDDMH